MRCVGTVIEIRSGCDVQRASSPTSDGDSAPNSASSDRDTATNVNVNGYSTGAPSPGPRTGGFHDMPDQAFSIRDLDTGKEYALDRVRCTGQ